MGGPFSGNILTCPSSSVRMEVYFKKNLNIEISRERQIVNFIWLYMDNYWAICNVLYM
jgi:hypothetical protein